MSALPGPIVSTAWLAEHLGRPDLVVVDASWYLPAMQRDHKAEYRSGHLPGALFWDIDLMSDPASDLPHMLPPPELAARQVSALGIGDHDLVVAYDGSGTNMSAPRVWWHLRALGHEAVAVLDGGRNKWMAEGRPMESGWIEPAPRRFTARPRPDLVRGLKEVRALVTSEAAVLLDARAVGRFEGREPEPRPGVRGGHIPGARNLPYTRLVGADGTMLDRAELRQRFEEAGVDLARPVVTSCGSGVTACALALGLEVLGHRQVAVYDGSWTEWGGRTDTPVETGA